MKKSNLSTRHPPKSSPRDRDPHLEREQRKYDHPIPSRELILSELADAGVPLELFNLMQRLSIKPDERESFGRRIGAMERDGQIMRNRRGDICLVDKLDLIAGRVQGHPDGFGFLVPDDGSEDLFLGPKEMQRVLNGDRIMVRAAGIDRKGRREAEIIEVLERVNTKVVGRLFVEHGVYFVVAENKRINQDILIEPGYDGGAKPGQVVMVELVAQPSKHAEPVARVLEIVGNYADPGMEIEIALRKHDLPHEWPPAVLALEKKVPKKVTAKDISTPGREDLRDYPFVTIDGETAKDFDDAVFCERIGRGKSAGYRLLVAIADVSHYVKTGDAFDQEARLRGNSVYFPRRVIPMLPEVLSNEMCSLKPKVDRLALVCDMTLSATGEIKQYRFTEAVFHSAARLTYTQVAQALYGLQAEAPHGIDDTLIPHLKNLDQVFRALLAARNKRGAIDFDTAETIMLFDEGGKILRIVPSVRNDAHRLIEECMLAANVCAANFLLAHEHPALYRIHEGPSDEKLLALRAMLKDFGLQLAGGKKPTTRDFAEVLTKIKPRPDAPLLQTVMLRSMKQAVYSPDNVGHFGLAYDAYTHFTSPIRRYPDLLTHRAIKAVLKGKTYDPKMAWDQLGMQFSATERRADEATRDVAAWLKCYYMKDRLGEIFTGTITGVTSFGIFITLDEVYVEGLVHISELGQDYFHFDADKHLILGERTRKKYQLADRVTIQVARVDIETSKIDFVLSHQAPQAVAAKPAVAGVPLAQPPAAVAPTPALTKAQTVAKATPKATVKTTAQPPGKAAAPSRQIEVLTVTSANPPTTPLAGFTPPLTGEKNAPGKKAAKIKTPVPKKTVAVTKRSAATSQTASTPQAAANRDKKSQGKAVPKAAPKAPKAAPKAPKVAPKAPKVAPKAPKAGAKAKPKAKPPTQPKTKPKTGKKK